MTPRISEIVVGDTGEAWEAAGFTVEDGICVVGTVPIRLAGREQGKRIRSWSLSGLVPGAVVDGMLDGLPTAVDDDQADAAAGVGAMPAHPNGARLIDHIVLVTPNQQRTVAALEAAGFQARRTRETDTYGAPFLQTFFRAGEVIVELIGPEEPSDDGPAAFFGLAYTVDDLDATKRLLGEGLGEPKDAVQPGRRIATLRHKQFDMSVATALMSPGPNALEER